MTDTGGSKNNLRELFEKMQYGNDLEDLSQCFDWLKVKGNRIFAYIGKPDEDPTGETTTVKNATDGKALCNVHVPEPATVGTILQKLSTSKNAWTEIPPIQRAEIIYKLGTEIQKKQDLFIQLEIAARGILKKDTKNKALSLLTDLLQYYSGFCVKSNTGDSTSTAKGLVVGIVPDFNSLCTLGYLLGPCLASGRQLVLQTGPKLSLVATLLIELATKLGVPEGTIKLIPGKVDPNVFFKHPEVSKISIFDDLYKKEYSNIANNSKKLLNFYSSGTSMIVFDNCDLDSACHSVADAAFGYKGMLPWSTRQIFVQESVWSKFLHKLKQRMEQIKIGKSNEVNIDIAYPDEEVWEKAKIVVDKARNEGVEVYEAGTENLGPALLVGSNVLPNNVIKEDDNLPITTVVAFRNINEAITLANNRRHGLGASVWTESTSLLNEIIEKLKVANIWVNSHALFAADVSVSPYKTSGNGFFGGKEGFSEYVTQAKSLTKELPPQIQNKEAMEKAITDAKNAQNVWCKFTRCERMKNLQLVAQTIQKNNRNRAEEWATLIHECLLNNSAESFSKNKSFNVMSIREPCGVIALESPDHNQRLIILALKEGNSVVILSDCKETEMFYSGISKLLPKGVLTVASLSRDATEVATAHRELNVYIGECSFVSLKSSSKFKVTSSDDWEEVRDKVSLVKNVWFNKGLSFM